MTASVLPYIFLGGFPGVLFGLLLGALLGSAHNADEHNEYLMLIRHYEDLLDERYGKFKPPRSPDVMDFDEPRKSSAA